MLFSGMDGFTNELKRFKGGGSILFWLRYQITDMLTINSHLAITNINALLRRLQQILLGFQIFLVRSLE